MRAIHSITVLLVATSVFAAENAYAALPANSAPVAAAGNPVYSVWAFKNVAGKWVKDNQYSWTTSDPVAGRAYARRVDAVPGWTATTNLPAATRQARRFGFGAAPNAGIVNNPANSLLTVNAGGYSISIPYSLIQRAGIDPRTIGSANLTDSGSDDTSSDIWPSASDTSAIDQSNALQDTLNQQQALNNEQENIDEQNFENTENMINSQNEANAAMQMGNP
jgi:hypothetical protein